MKLYGTSLCPDCVEAFEKLKKENISYEYINISNSIAEMKEFIRLRDNKKEFDDIKKQGYIGIPCYVLNDDKIIFDTDEVINMFIVKKL